MILVSTCMRWLLWHNMWSASLLSALAGVALLPKAFMRSALNTLRKARKLNSRKHYYLSLVNFMQRHLQPLTVKPLKIPWDGFIFYSRKIIILSPVIHHKICCTFDFANPKYTNKCAWCTGVSLIAWLMPICTYHACSTINFVCIYVIHVIHCNKVLCLLSVWLTAPPLYQYD